MWAGSCSFVAGVKNGLFRLWSGAHYRAPTVHPYAAFFSDVEHEVTSVIAGHRVTLTYNLYFDDIGISEDSVSRPLLRVSTQAANERTFHETFEALLQNPEFLADGGTLAF